MQQFDIHIPLVWRLRQVHTVKLNGILWFVEKPTFWKLPDVTISLKFCQTKELS